MKTIVSFVLTGFFAVCALFAPKTARAATITVTSTNDSGAGTLRQAITSPNGNPGLDTIVFSIGSGAKTIKPLSPLPAITSPAVIDGTIQPGFSGAPIIELEGSAAGLANGLNIESGGCTVKGLVINRFAYSGIALVTNAYKPIEGNYIGTTAAGTASAANCNGGIIIVNSHGNIVGGATTSVRNVISGNTREGIAILNSASRSNLVEGNYIGFDYTGTQSLSNSGGRA